MQPNKEAYTPKSFPPIMNVDGIKSLYKGSTPPVKKSAIKLVKMGRSKKGGM